MLRPKLSRLMHALLAACIVLSPLVLPPTPALAQDRPSGQIAFIEEAPHRFLEVLDTGTGRKTDLGTADGGFGWTPDGTSLIVAGYAAAAHANTVSYLMRVAPDGSSSEPFPDPGGPVTYIAVGDGESIFYLAEGDFGEDLYRFDPATGESTLVWKNPGGPCGAMRLSVASGTQQAAISSECGTGAGISLDIQIVDLRSGEANYVTGSSFTDGECAGMQRNMFDAQLAASGRLAYIESDDCYNMVTGETTSGMQRVIDGATGRVLVEQPQILAIAWSPDERWLAYSDDETIAAVDVNSGAVVPLYAGVGRMFDLAWNPVPADVAPAPEPVATPSPEPVAQTLPTAGLPAAESEMVPLEPALQWRGEVYKLYYMRLPGQEDLTPRQLFNLLPRDDGSPRPVEGLVLARSDNLVTDPAVMRDFLLAYAAAVDLYGPAAAPPFPYYHDDLQAITGNPLVQASAVSEFVKSLLGSSADQTEEALRGMLTAEPGASYRLTALQDRVLAGDTKSYAGAMELLNQYAETQRAANTDMWGVMPTELQAAFNDLDAGTLAGSVSMKAIRLLASTLFLSHQQEDRAKVLAQFLDYPVSSNLLDDTQLAAAHKVLAEADDLAGRRREIVVDMLGDEGLDKVLSAAGTASTKGISRLVQQMASQQGATLSAHAVAGALSAVGVGLTLGNILYGIDSLYAHFQVAERAEELRTAFELRRLSLQTAAKAKAGGPWNGEAAEEFRTAYIMENLAAIQTSRSYADGVEATYALPNPLSVIRALIGQDWRSAVEGIRDMADQAEINLNEDYLDPRWFAAATLLMDRGTAAVQLPGYLTGMAYSASPAPGATASLPTPSDLKKVKNLWDPLKFVDRKQPGTETYAATVAADDVLRWGFTWCAKDSTLLDRALQPLTVALRIDGELVADNLILKTTSSSGTWECFNWSTLLSDWLAGQQVTLELEYTLAEDVNDGVNTYSSGTYVHHIVVDVKN